MGIFGLHLPKKVNQVIGGVERQLNPFDNGATYKNPKGNGQHRSVIQQAGGLVNDAVVKPFGQFESDVANQLYNRGIAPIFSLPKFNSPQQTPGIPGVIAKKSGATGTVGQTLGSGIITASNIFAPGEFKAAEAGLTKILPKTVPNVVKTVAPRVVGGGVAGGVTGAAAGAGSYVSGVDQQHPFNAADLAKSAGKGLEYGAALGAAAPAAGIVAKEGGKAAVKGAKVVVKNAKVLNENRVPLNEAGAVKVAPGAKATKPSATASKVKVTKVDPLAPGGIGSQLKETMVEEDTPIIRELKNIENQTGQKGLVDTFLYKSGLQRRSNSIGVHHFQESPNVQKAINGLDKQQLNEFNTYAAARRELANSKSGLKTSRPVSELKQTVKDLGPAYSNRFDALNKHFVDLAGKLKAAGVIDAKKYKQFTSDKNYVRVQRNMDELINKQYGSGNSYSLGSTITSKKRTGSTREIVPTTHTALDYTQRVHNEITRNATASHLIDTLEKAGQAKRVPATARNRNTIRRFVNGKVQIYEVSPEIKRAVERINPFELNMLNKIVAGPGRLFRATTTGLNPVFTATNYARDQLSSSVFSTATAATHNPANIADSLYKSVRELAGGNTHDQVWQKFIAHAGDQTSYDLTRNLKGANRIVKEVQGNQVNRVGRIVLNPVRSLEDLNSVTEKATRFQNFKGVYEKAIAAGKPESAALQEATLAAWQNSVDFNRAGSWGRMLNLLIPYWNPGVQGARQLFRGLENRPGQTVGKAAAILGAPVAAATIWNTEDKNRRKIYNNIPDYEKQNNIILIPPGTKQNKDGTYDVWKLPLPPGVGQLTGPGRRAVESFVQKKPADVKGMAQDLFTAVGGPVSAESPTQFVQSFEPQIARPFINQAANKDLYTGKAIVPDYLQQESPKNQKYKFSSGTATIVGNKANVSPIRIEKAVKDVTGTVGLYGLNAADNALVKAGVIKPDQVGGISIKEGFARRFAKAQGIENFNKSDAAKYYDTVKKATAGLNKDEQAAFLALHPSKKSPSGKDLYTGDSVYNSAARLDIYNRYPKVFQADKKINADGVKRGAPNNPLFDLQSWQVKKVLEKQNLPPGATDPELSKLKDQIWYQDFQAKQSKYYSDLPGYFKKQIADLRKQGDKTGADALQKSEDKFNSSDNPYPATPSDLQKIMDTYTALPKGTGARSAWIRANPGQWARMQDQFAKIDNWENVKRGKRGLDATQGATGVAAGYGSGSSGYSYGSRGRSSNTINVASYLKKYSGTTGQTKKGASGIQSSSPKVTVKRSNTGKIKVSSQKVRLA